LINQSINPYDSWAGGDSWTAECTCLNYTLVKLLGILYSEVLKHLYLVLKCCKNLKEALEWPTD